MMNVTDGIEDRNVNYEAISIDIESDLRRQVNETNFSLLHRSVKT